MKTIEVPPGAGAKYLAKSLGDHHVAGEHRYERAQGFAVELVRRAFAMRHNAEAWLMLQDGGGWALMWSSDECESPWDGPPPWVYATG